jgi:hypothetical protein
VAVSKYAGGPETTVAFSPPFICPYIEEIMARMGGSFNLLNAELNPICHSLALLGAHPILHISRIRVNKDGKRKDSKKGSKWKFSTTRPVGRPRIRWADVVQRDTLQLPETRRWRRRAVNRDEWKHLMRKATARKGQ